MKVWQGMVASMLLLAGAAVMADGGDIGIPLYPVAAASNLSRSAVQRSVMSARGDGDLRPAGEAGDAPRAFERPTHSVVTRQQVRLATLAAARAGEIAPAGIDYADRPSGEYVRSISPRPVGLFAPFGARPHGD